MKIAVTDTTDQPIYRQIYDQLRFDILRGDLAPGSVLPPIRTVAAQLRISVISVKRAWEELTRDGYITTAVGRGSFVAELEHSAMEQLRRSVLEEKLTAGVRDCRALGASLPELITAVTELYGQDEATGRDSPAPSSIRQPQTPGS